MSFVLSIVDAVSQKQCSHLLVARFSQVFVLQLVHHGDVSASPACFSEAGMFFPLLSRNLSRPQI